MLLLLLVSRRRWLRLHGKPWTLVLLSSCPLTCVVQLDGSPQDLFSLHFLDGAFALFFD